MPNASRQSAASDHPRTTNSRKCDCSRTLAAGILQIAVDAKAVRRCALTLPGMTAIEHFHDNPPFPVIERATTLVRKGQQPGRLNSYVVDGVYATSARIDKASANGVPLAPAAEEAVDTEARRRINEGFELGQKLLNLQQFGNSNDELAIERLQQQLAKIGEELGIDPGAFLWPGTLTVDGLNEEEKLHFLSLMQQGVIALGARDSIQAELTVLENRRNSLVRTIVVSGIYVNKELGEVNAEITALETEIANWNQVLSDLEEEYNSAGFRDLQVKGFHVRRSNPETNGDTVSGVGFQDALKAFIAATTFSSSSGGAVPTYIEFEVASWWKTFSGIAVGIGLRAIGRGGVRAAGKELAASGANVVAMTWKQMLLNARRCLIARGASGILGPREAVKAFKEILAETRIAVVMEYKGYKLMASKLPSNQGIDQLWVKYGPTGAVGDIIVMEAKFNAKGRLVLSKGADKGDQMSNLWINNTIKQMKVSKDAKVVENGKLLNRMRDKIGSTTNNVRCVKRR